jgi:hypothetical protein
MATLLEVTAPTVNEHLAIILDHPGRVSQTLASVPFLP